MPDLWTEEETETLLRAKNERALSVPHIQKSLLPNRTLTAIYQRCALLRSASNRANKMVQTRRSVGQLRPALTQSRRPAAQDVARANGHPIYDDHSSVADSDGDDAMEEAPGDASQESQTDQNVRSDRPSGAASNPEDQENREPRAEPENGQTPRPFNPTQPHAPRTPSLLGPASNAEWARSRARIPGLGERHPLGLITKSQMRGIDAIPEAAPDRQTSPGLLRRVVANGAIAAMEGNRNGLRVRQNTGGDAAAGPSGTRRTLRSATQARPRSARNVLTPSPEALEARSSREPSVPASPTPRAQPVQPPTAPPTPPPQGQSETAVLPAPQQAEPGTTAQPAAPAPAVADDINAMAGMVNVTNLEQPDLPTTQEQVRVRTPEQVEEARTRREQRARQRTRGASDPTHRHVAGAAARPQGIKRRPQGPQGDARAKFYSQPVAPVLNRIKRESDDDAKHWERHAAISKRHEATSAATRRRAEELITRLHRPHELTVGDVYSMRCLIDCHQCTQYAMDRQ